MSKKRSGPKKPKTGKPAPATVAERDRRQEVPARPSPAAMGASLKTAAQKTDRLCAAAAARLSRFAEKRCALPVLVLAAFFGFWLTSYVGGYQMFHLKTEMQFTFYQFYLCDFSAGFCSRVIVGAVTGLFLDQVSVAQMNAIAGAAVLVSFVLFSLIIGAVLRKGLRERAFLPVLLALLLLFEPVIVLSNYMFLGTLDVYVLILFLLILGAYGTPLFYAAAPLLSLLALTVHYHYLFSYFPAVMALFIYDGILGEKKSVRIGGAAGFGVTAATSGPLFVYLVFFAKNHLKCTADEFYDRMAARFALTPAARRGLERVMNGNVVFRDYFDYYIFGYNEGTYYYGNGGSFIDFLRRDRLSRTIPSLYYKYFAYTLPVFAAFILIWVVCASRQKGVRRAPYLVFACLPLALFPELFISSDVPRWMAATLTCQFALLFAAYSRGDASLRGLLRGRDRNAAVGRFICAACAAAYAAVMLFIGRDMPMFY